MNKVTGKGISESARRIPEIMKISSDKTCEQDRISKLINIWSNNVNNVIVVTFTIN